MGTSTTPTQIWEEHGDNLKAFICKKVDGGDHCHDILHDVFLKINDNKERLKWVEQPASYVIKMAQNAVMDYFRSQRKAPQSLQDDLEFTDEHLLQCN